MSLFRIAINITSTDQSLAYGLREAFLKEFLALFPTATFEDKLYDTSEQGKGYRPGFVSFALKPIEWANKGLIGGVLIRGSYNPQVIRSTAPEEGTPDYKSWIEQGGNQNLEGGEAEVMNIVAGYYNKKANGSFQRERELGDVIFTISKTEEVESMEIDDPDGVKTGVEAVIQDIMTDPPDMAIGAQLKKKQNIYNSVRKFIDHKREDGSNKFTMEEARRLSDGTGKNLNNLVEHLRKNQLSLVG